MSEQTKTLMRDKMRNKTGFWSSLFLTIGSGFILIALLLCLYNIWDEYQAKLSVQQTLSKFELSETSTPDHLLDPNRELQAVEVNGKWYIGMLEIPSLALKLPVIQDWSYPDLKAAPCRYRGSAYTDDMIIAAHNYKSHFGPLSTISIGDAAKFTDMSGNEFVYSVVQLELLEGTAVEDMEAGDWDLTLFTCTPGGQARVTVRLDRTS